MQLVANREVSGPQDVGEPPLLNHGYARGLSKISLTEEGSYALAFLQVFPGSGFAVF